MAGSPGFGKKHALFVVAHASLNPEAVR